MPATPDLALVGVVHLLPLPAGPRRSPGLDAVLDRALADAETLVRGGVSGCIVENLGDAPFPATSSEPHVPAVLAVLADRLRRAFGDALTVGVNALRNDARAALAAAVAGGACFVRVNILAGAAWTDQGLVEGDAHRLLRYRRELGADPADAPPRGGVRIFADVFVKHAEPLGWGDIAAAAVDTHRRAGADALIVTGAHTGGPTSLDDLDRVRDAVPTCPVWVGSGVTAATVGQLRGRAHGAIVGTWLHEASDLARPLDRVRVRELVEAVRA